MPQINVGVLPDDGTGDTLRTAGLKINQWGQLNDKTVNAAFYKTGGLSNEAAITAAIVGAAALGSGTAVWIPQSMLPYNASLVTFNPAVKMMREGGRNELYDVQAYGADPLGVQTSTAAMQAAHNTGGLVYYAAGTYLFSTITGLTSGGIVGDGPQKTILSSSDTTSAQLITFTGNYAAHLGLAVFRDFSLGTPTNIKAAGAGIQVIPATGEASYLQFDNIYFANCPIGIDFVAASLWKVTNCQFLTFSIAGVQVANTNAADSGDSTIAHCMFNNNLGTGAGVLQLSSGGLRVIGNKFLGGAYGYRLTFNGTTSTGTLLIGGNSIEQAATAGISLERASGTFAFKNIIISDNEFGNQQRHVSTDSNTFLSELAIVGNLFHMNGGGGTIYGVSMTNVVDFLIASNHFRGEGGSSSGVTLATCSNGRVGPNYYINVATNVTLTTCTAVDQWDALSVPTGVSGFFSSNWGVQHAGTSVFNLQSTDAALDAKAWRVYSTTAGQFIIDAIKDDGSVANALLTLSRSGANATGISFGAAMACVLNTPTETVLVSGIDARSGNVVEVTLTAARLVGAPTNPVTGQRMTFTFIQSGAGAFAVTWNAVFKVSWSDAGNTTPKRSSISFIYDGTNWNQDGAQTPYV